jgi:TetR/AcrR family transcriptional regulator, transcriptional repressor of aconitase
MARVSQEHLDARRRQILDAARRCFVLNGFHATSMQDILYEANLSAGGLYRYFRSKDDIIAAIATDSLAEVTRAFEGALDSDPPPPLDEALGYLFASLEQLSNTQHLDRLAIQVWAEALRSPSVAERVTESANSVRDILTRLVEMYQTHDMISRDVPAEHVARLLAGLVPGFMVQHALFGDVDAAMLRDAVRAIANSTNI